ncbi:MAG: PIN domain-containing protein [Gammaproteobacteria bacterium]|nr:PIN domain-containing protein [Gammaproteobacteria bacterium]MBU1443043.1 PIN domain-containing protein [Gammaproteobacteria bacterium]
MRALFDVSVLIALFDSEHVHHVDVAQWFADNAEFGWATCPLTQNGCIRILSQPAYANQAPAAVVAEILAEAAADSRHEFWPDSFSLLTPGALKWDNLLTGRHLTDVYLLSLAHRHGGRLVTLDRGIPLSVVPDARPENLTVIFRDPH